MGREEHDREDLLADARALVERIELRTAGEDEPVVVGFRRDGCGSVYFGLETVYHFNAIRQLRRAYCSGVLYKAEGGKLLSLERRRTPTETQLVARELDDVLTLQLLGEAKLRLERLSASVSAGCQIVGQVPPTADVLGRVRSWLGETLSAIGTGMPLAVAASPHAR